MSDIMFKEAPGFNPAITQVSDSASAEMTQVTGVNEELLGSSVDDKAGILSMLRQRAGLTTLEPLFDPLNLSQKLLGRVMLKTIQSNFTPGKIARIIEEEPTEEFYHKAFGKYDAAVVQGINTTTQRQEAFATMFYLREAGLPIPDEALIEASTIENKTELVQLMAQQKEQESQVQMAQMQSQLDLANAQIESLQAKAKADLGWAFERTSRVPENRAFAIERLAEAEKDRQQAVLNMAKTLNEIDDIKLNQLEKLIQLTNMLTQQSVPEKIDVKTPSDLESIMLSQASSDNNKQVQSEQQKKV